MTIVIALQCPATGRAAIGSDGRATVGSAIRSKNVRKFRRVGNMWIGVSGPLRGTNALSKLPECSAAEELLDEFRFVMEEEAWELHVPEDGGPLQVPVNGVIVDQDGCCYEFDSTLASSPMTAGEPAVAGSGAYEALAAAKSYMLLADGAWEPVTVLRHAIEVCSEIEASCGGEIFSETIDPEAICAELVRQIAATPPPLPFPAPRRSMLDRLFGRAA